MSEPDERDEERGPPLPGPLPLKGAREKEGDPARLALTAALSRGRERGERKAPRWVRCFLRALERSGQVRAAAADAGIDHSSAYARRRAHADFAAAWDEALAAHAAALGALPPVAARPVGPAAGGTGGDDALVACNGQRRRAGHDRWTAAKERLFFAELAASANVTRAARAAGVSTTAVYARRLKHPPFREQWDAVRESVGAAIDMNLAAAARRAFDPDALDVAIEPKVSVPDAIRILQLQRGAGEKTGEKAGGKAGEKAGAVEAYDVGAVARRLEHKMAVLFETEQARLRGDGWSYDEEYRELVPPGWVRAEAAGDAAGETGG